ncbi:MAG: carboxypeptidase-like regulatory domain-containing protein, partial [Bryobacteraceae bacterium]
MVEGWVFDPTGRPVPASEVLLISRQTGQEQRAETDETGKYFLPSVPVGEYTLRITKHGFREVELTGIRVLVGQRVSQSVKLELGAISESLVVTDTEGSLRETSSNQLGTLIEPVSVQRLPLNGRNYLQLGYLSGAAQEAGSNPSNFTATQTGFADRTITIAGVQQDFTSYLINGLSASGTRIGQLALNVSVSAVDQFKVVQGFVLPSLGPDPGVVNLATRSGGSSFHGDAFEFHRNSALDARDFFETRRNPGPFVRNQFGLALGGPLWPQRAFFFANYEGQRQRLSAPQGAFSPTAAMFEGDFSALPSLIYDPESYQTATGSRLAFPGNRIPATRLNSVAQRLTNYYLPGASYNQRPLNVFRQPKQTALLDQGGIKVDLLLAGKGLVSGQYMEESSHITQPGVHPLTGLYYTLRMHLAGLQWTANLDPRTVNLLQVGFTRPYLFYGGIGEADLQQRLGITGTADVHGVPSIVLNGFSGFGAPQSLIGNIDNNYQLSEMISLVRGRHEFAAGAQVRYIRTVQESANWNARGTLLFSGVFTAQMQPGASSRPIPVPGTGSSFADFLLGYPVSGTVTSMPRTHYR